MHTQTVSKGRSAPGMAIESSKAIARYSLPCLVLPDLISFTVAVRMLPSSLVGVCDGPLALLVCCACHFSAGCLALTVHYTYHHVAVVVLLGWNSKQKRSGSVAAAVGLGCSYGLRVEADHRCWFDHLPVFPLRFEFPYGWNF